MIEISGVEWFGAEKCEHGSSARCQILLCYPISLYQHNTSHWGSLCQSVMLSVWLHVAQATFSRNKSMYPDLKQIACRIADRLCYNTPAPPKEWPFYFGSEWHSLPRLPTQIDDNFFSVNPTIKNPSGKLYLSILSTLCSCPTPDSQVFCRCQ